MIDPANSFVDIRVFEIFLYVNVTSPKTLNKFFTKQYFQCRRAKFFPSGWNDRLVIFQPLPQIYFLVINRKNKVCDNNFDFLSLFLSEFKIIISSKIFFNSFFESLAEYRLRDQKTTTFKSTLNSLNVHYYIFSK